MKLEIACRDQGRPGCLGVPDERYTMPFPEFDDVLYWCAHCGPEAHAMNAALMAALETRGPEFCARAEAAIAAAEAEEQRRRQ
jgi:hypothetical protein